MTTEREWQAYEVQKRWSVDERWAGIRRGYEAKDVVRLRGSLKEEHTLARRGAERLWNSLKTEPYVNALGALTGMQALQQALSLIHI